jgi:hypothetical protein
MAFVRVQNARILQKARISRGVFLMETDDPGREENLQSLEMGRPSEGR